MTNLTEFGIPDAARTRHVYVAGKTQQGKSTLIFWMALQDIDRGKGVCVIDPHGDLVNKMIHHIPKHRIDDTVYLDFSAPIPLDFFGAQTDLEKEYLSDDIISTFKRLSGVDFGVRMDSILRNVVGALAFYKEATFLDIHRMITDETFRRERAAECDTPVIRQYFRKDGEFDKERGDSKLGITSRMTKFLLTPVLETIVGHPEPKLRISSVMDKSQVLLVNLSKLGEETKQLLGTLLVSKIQRSALQRAAQKPQERVPFFLYVDEFQNFQTSSFDTILSEGGKYKLCLTIAHQYLDQLEPRMKSSILGNISTFVLFRMHEKDAKQFKGEIAVDNLAHLKQGQAIYRPYTGETYTINTPEPPALSSQSYAEYIRTRTIERYSCKLVTRRLSESQEDITGSPRRLTRHAHSAKAQNTGASS